MNTWRKDWREKGFTMAELLIVVAIIAVLAAIAIPIFTSQLEKSREGADADAIRNAYAQAALVALDGGRVETADAVARGTTTTNNVSSTWVVEGPIDITQEENLWAYGPYDIAGLTIAQSAPAPVKTGSTPLKVYVRYVFTNNKLASIAILPYDSTADNPTATTPSPIEGCTYTASNV